MTLRLFIDSPDFPDSPLAANAELSLPPDAARHVQVCRLQPGDPLVLFDGRGGEWTARVREIGRREVAVRIESHVATDAESPGEWCIALGMPANERMDALVEKATELGVARIQPLLTERSVLRLEGERAARRVAHWQAVARSASEQSGRTRVPHVEPVSTLAAWLSALPEVGTLEVRHLMSLAAAPALAAAVDAVPGSGDAGRCRWWALSGPEGGLSAAEEDAARARGFAPVSLGPRILRADTAPLAWLAQLDLLLGRRSVV